MPHCLLHKQGSKLPADFTVTIQIVAREVNITLKRPMCILGDTAFLYSRVTLTLLHFQMSLRIKETKRLYCHVMCNALQNDLYPLLKMTAQCRYKYSYTASSKKEELYLILIQSHRKIFCLKKMRHNYSYLFSPNRFGPSLRKT